MLAMVNDMFYRMQSCLHKYWHIVGCPNLFCKLTNKFKALMDSTTNLLHVQVARMLAFVLWDSHWQEIWEIAKSLTFTQTIF